MVRRPCRCHSEPPPLGWPTFRARAADSGVRITRQTDLPTALPDGATVYVRPTGLSTGIAGKALREAGFARPLAGGPCHVGNCEVWIRTPARIDVAAAPLRTVADWLATLPAETAGPLTETVRRLAVERIGPAGQPLRRPLIMGVINATPDSFSDGGEMQDVAAAVAHGCRLAEAGADILDVGGESVRPGARPVSLDEERDRVLPVVEGLAAETPALVSIDTRKAGVMRAALDAGAGMINDVTALTGDPDSLAVAAGSDARVVLMHMQGEPATMNDDPRYACAPLDIYDFLEARIAACEAAGIARWRLIVDPGIGFGKRGAHNMEILRMLSLFHGLGCPILLGVSRKGLTGAMDRARPPKERLAGSLAAAIAALDQGVQMLRVHDVAETRQALDVWEGVVGAVGDGNAAP